MPQRQEVMDLGETEDKCKNFSPWGLVDLHLLMNHRALSQLCVSHGQ